MRFEILERHIIELARPLTTVLVNDPLLAFWGVPVRSLDPRSIYRPF